MPTIFRLHCNVCGFGPPVVSQDGVSEANPEGTCLSDSYLLFRRDDGELIPLPHPREGLALKEHGGDWTSARKSGSIINVDYRSCDSCGAINEDMRISQVSGGCAVVLFGVIISVGVYFVVATYFGFHFFVAYFSGFATFCLVSFIDTVLAKYRYRAMWSLRNKELRLQKCVVCGGGKFSDFGLLSRRKLMCSRCKTRDVQCSVWGKS